MTLKQLKYLLGVVDNGLNITAAVGESPGGTRTPYGRPLHWKRASVADGGTVVSTKISDSSRTVPSEPRGIAR